MRILIIFMLLFQLCHGQAQSIQSSEAIFLDLQDSIALNEVIVDDNDFVAIGQYRFGIFLKAYLTRFSKSGAVLLEKSIGSPNEYRRASAILKLNKSYWVLINSLVDNKRQIKLSEFDYNFNEIMTLDLSKTERIDGISLAKISDNEIAILINYDLRKYVHIPEVIKYNVQSKELSSYLFDQNNYSIYPSRDGYVNKDGSATSYADTSSYYTKIPGNVDIINNKIYVVGSEDTRNFQDHWAGCKDLNNKLIWDRLLEKERDPGVDVLVRALKASKGSTALFGQHYTKLKAFTYNFNYLLVDMEGDLLIEKRYSLGFEEHIVSAFRMGNNYLMSGYVSEEPNKKGVIGEIIDDVNLWYVLINEKGDILSQDYLKQNGFQKLSSSVLTRNNELLSVFNQTYSDHDGYYMIITSLLD